MDKITVLGSINMDIVLKVNNMVQVGETIISNSFNKIPGGKGANQAVALARLGAEVYMIGKTGKDDNGQTLINSLKNDNINIKYIDIDEKEPTGMAIIQVNNAGNNSIVVVPGANMNIKNSQIDYAKDIIKESKIIIAQFETPVEVTTKAFKLAKENNVTTILNPAPAREIPDELLKYTDIIIPNETEAFEITKINVENKEDIKRAAKFFLDKGVRYVIITLGERGAALVSKEDFEIIPAYEVKAVDTTAAGDSFIGALANKLIKEDKVDFENLKHAINFGNRVSSIVVQRQGAQTSIPYLQEIDEIFKED